MDMANFHESLTAITPQLEPTKSAIESHTSGSKRADAPNSSSEQGHTKASKVEPSQSASNNSNSADASSMVPGGEESHPAVPPAPPAELSLVEWWMTEGNSALQLADNAIVCVSMNGAKALFKFLREEGCLKNFKDKFVGEHDEFAGTNLNLVYVKYAGGGIAPTSIGDDLNMMIALSHANQLAMSTGLLGEFCCEVGKPKSGAPVGAEMAPEYLKLIDLTMKMALSHVKQLTQASSTGLLGETSCEVGKPISGAPVGAEMAPEYLQLIQYFRENDPPTNFGDVYDMPLDIPGQNLLPRKFFVRKCFEILRKIVENTMDAKKEMYAKTSAIFTGPQGNGKTWFSWYVVWMAVRRNRTVILESCEFGYNWVIPKDSGPMRIVPAVNDSFCSKELADPETVFVFDAKRNAVREPVVAKCVTLVFSSHNVNSYAQFERNVSSVAKFCIPNYEEDELVQLCDFFKVSEQEVRDRCAAIGPSMRYVLAVGPLDSDFEKVLRATRDKAVQVNINGLEIYLRDQRSYQVGGPQNSNSSSTVVPPPLPPPTTGTAGSSLQGVSTGMATNPNDLGIGSCLLRAIISDCEEDDERERIDAYREENVLWRVASRPLAILLVNESQSRAEEFLRYFLTTVDEKNKTHLKGMAGNFLELILPDLLCQATVCRRLRERMDDKNDPAFAEKEIRLIPSRDTWEHAPFVKIETALAECQQEDKAYLYVGTMPAIDASYNAFQVLIQSTFSAKSHLVHLETIQAVCKYVRELHDRKCGESSCPVPVVKLFFVVPSKAYSSWEYTQSYRFVGEKRKQDSEGATVMGNRQSKTLSENQVLGMHGISVHQYVLKLDITKKFSVSQVVGNSRWERSIL